MPDHKFEPGQLVLVRDGVDETWMLRQFSYFDKENCLPFRVMPDTGWKQCIPFSAETKHLQNTKIPYDPYEPPKTPVDYEFGDKVILKNGAIGIYIEYENDSIKPHQVFEKGDVVPHGYGDYDIRPLPDSAAQ